MKSFLPLLAIALALPGPIGAAPENPILMKDRRELFLDDLLIYKRVGVEMRLANPTPAGVALRFNAPWEGRFSGAYVTVIKDGPLYRMFYRATDEGPAGQNEVTCYAESNDGITWRKPSLGVHDYHGSRDNNLIMPPGNPYRASHTFSVFLDERPGIPPAERYKAVGGGLGTAAEQKASGVRRGLYRFVSPDGIHWTRCADEPLFTGWALDSQNVLTWVPAEQCYAIYLRTWTGDEPGKPHYKGIRLIARTTSKDFVHWTEPQLMNFGDAPIENLYTNATAPYFRAPQILIAMPFRFSPERRLLSEAELKEWDIHPTMWNGVSDAVIMTSRGGLAYERQFMESFVRPGMDLSNWAARSNIPALGVVQTGPAEMSIYLSCGYGSKNRRIERRTLRLDGFASLHAGYQPGYAITNPLVLSGNRLEANFSASSIGFIKVSVLDMSGVEIPGFGEAEAEELAGDAIDRAVRWKGEPSVASLAGKIVRLKLTIRDADLYSIGVFNH